MVSKLPDQLLVPVLTVLLREWQALLAIGQRLAATFVKSQPQGIFEVLDYDSTLDLMDNKGKKAVFRRHQKVRFLQDHVTAFQDFVWGDGDVLADYKIAPGVEVDRFKESDRWNLLISLRETKSRGDIEEFHIERTVQNGFTKPTEWRQTEIWLRTHQLRLAIIFPRTRHCKRALLHKRSVDKTIELGGEHIQPLPDGRQIVTWTERNPKTAEIYTIRWEW